MTEPQAAERFRYDGYHVDQESGAVTCHYSVGGRSFTERVTLGPGPGWSTPAADAAARIVHLLAGVSYFKTAAPPVVDLGDLPTTATERDFLRTFYVEGLAEFAYRNGLDLSGLEVVGPDLGRSRPASAGAADDRPLVPFGGGIDSIVTAEAVRERHPDAALFVVSRSGNRFEAIERPARLTGLPVLRAGREIDPRLLRSAELGFLNGHVPVTGIISAVAVLAAVVFGRDAVVMSNEWSASAGNLEVDGRTVNHQWSKGLGFERAFGDLLAATFDRGPRYFSLLRPYSELWVARRFAALTRYHRDFRSCNRAFHLDPAKRLDRWCGTCDKCCFIDLVLAPFMPAGELAAVFDGREPLADEALLGRFRTLAGSSGGTKPFECVGEVGECRAAVRLAAARPDRAGNAVLAALSADLAAETPASRVGGDPDASAADLLRPIGEHRVPDAFAPQDQLV
jgi:UDP-N-acetyl-alpha-D-muramoyl-L-alanyl-L-glutamate epimerase